MARKEIVQFYDDLDNSPLSADEVAARHLGYARAIVGAPTGRP